MKKTGEVSWYVVDIILLVIVLGIAFYLLFQEYFNQDEINYETCRQSVVLRSGNIANGVKIFQENFPFKCKTQVIEIDFKDSLKATKLVEDTMASCWALYGEGKTKLYSDDIITPSDKKCFVCARIHFDDKVKDYYITSRLDKKTGEPASIYLKRDLINDKMENSDITYGMYIYGIPEGQGYQLSEKPYANADWNWVPGPVKYVLELAGFKDSLERLKFTTEINSTDGDFFITLMYNQANFFGRILGLSDTYMVLVPHQYPVGQLPCDSGGIETIPA